MSMQTTVTRRAQHYSLSTTMDPAAEKEERKREYNRLAQREFRRRRKEHLKTLEQAQREQSTEQTEEIERLRHQNEELRRENEALKAQIYGPSSSSSHDLMSNPLSVPPLSNERAYSLSPSISAASMSGAGSPPPSLGSGMMGLTLTSTMLPPSLVTYADPSALSDQPYSMVPPSGIRHSSQSSPESSGYGSSRPAMGASFHNLNVPGTIPTQASHLPHSRGSGSQLSSTMMGPYSRSKAKADIMEMFRPLTSDPSVATSSERHLAVLRSLSDSLPGVLKPSKNQLETPHYYGIDLVPSPSLRERLLNVTADVAQTFLSEIGITSGGERNEMGQLIVWGDDAFNETTWEFSQTTLEGWGWFLGREWVQRSNFWRQQRGAPQLPDW